MNSNIKKVLIILYNRFWPAFLFLFNPLVKRYYVSKERKYYNLGCSGWRLPNFWNVDIRPTLGTHFTSDLTTVRFTNDAQCFFSNAFFEHVYRLDRISHLKSLYNSLRNDGFVCYMGIPNFREIAKAYLEGKENFDLFMVYRYTHGDPDRMSWYIQQLHKSLFDEKELRSLLQESGFSSFVLFEYVYPGDLHQEKINIGFYASKLNKEEQELQKDCLSFLQQFSNVLIIPETIEFV